MNNIAHFPFNRLQNYTLYAFDYHFHTINRSIFSNKTINSINYNYKL